MIKNFNGTGLTTSPGNYRPPVGKKWKVLNGFIQMTTGTGTGTRRVYLYHDQNNAGSGIIMLDTAAQTGTSESFVGIFVPNGSYSTQGVTVTSSYDTPVFIAEWDYLEWNITLIAGDKFDFYLAVEESEA